MKKQLLFLTTALLSLSTFAQIPNYVPSNGLVGWWPFNGNANDESGNNLNGTVIGSNLTTDRIGNSNSAFDFNFNNASFGSQNHEIYIPYSPVLNVNQISVSVWLYPRAYFWPSNPGSSAIINRYQYGYSNPNGQAWGIGFTESSVSGSIITSNGTAATSVTSNLALALNTWHHLVLTYDLVNIKLFIDGVLSSVQPYNGAMNISGNSGISIGESNQANGYWHHTDGKIDDIGIWNRALTACEIQNLYQSQAISAGADQSICSGDPVTLNGSGGSSYQWNNNVIDGQAFTPNQSANYVVNGTDSLGCQGTDTVVVTVLENAVSTLTQTALDSYTLNGQTYTQSGTYIQTLTAANGCDSTITLNLTLNFTGMDELGKGAKKLVKITDLNGKVIPRRKNTLMLFIYEDGTIERVVEMEE